LPNKTVAIIGGGIAGISAALELSHYDLDIHLIEKDYFLGGQAINYNCKANGQCLQCYACLVEQKLKELNQANNVHIHLASRISKFNKDANYELELVKDPLFDSEKEQEILKAAYKDDNNDGIVLRGASKNNIPFFALNLDKIKEQDQGFSSPALSKLYEQLDLNRSKTKQSLEVQGIILATGFQPFDPRRIQTYHYPVLDNVVSAFDMEKMRKAKGDYLRPSDNNLPQKISFIQCVGSRSETQGNLWCSRVCCPYALKMAEAIKTENPDIDITFFYMDVQNAGRNPTISPESYTSRFRFMRMMPVDILPGSDSSVIIRYMSSDQDKIESEDFDLAILSIGIEPNPENEQISDMFNLDLDKYGFLEDRSSVANTYADNNGIFSAGTATGPKNIAESIEHAGQAVKDLLTFLSDQENKEYGYQRQFIFNQNTSDRRGLDRNLHS